MSDFRPDKGALPNDIEFTRQLSTRDVSLQIPLNFVTSPGIAVTAACFPQRVYEDVAAQRCFSNLLAMGFRRFDIDVYWDATRHVWSLCPVELGEAASVGNATSSTTSSSPQSLTTGSTNRSSSTEIGVRARDFFSIFNLYPMQVRQATTPTGTQTSLSHQISPLALTAGNNGSVSATRGVTTGEPTQTTNPSGGPESIVTAGPYTCSTSCNLRLLTATLESHLNFTGTDVNATVKYLIMNLHVAAPESDPAGSALQPSTVDLPNADNLLSSILMANTSAYLYTPDDLANQRADLNRSWFGMIKTPRPFGTYYDIVKTGDHASTPDGWPSESFVEMQEAKRVLVGYGQIDPQIENYNFSGDASTIFPQEYLRHERPVSVDGNGDVTSGCFFLPGVFAVSSTNSSWATAVDASTASSNAQNLQLTTNEGSNLTYCGISPVLNETLVNVSADQDYRPYKTYVQNTIWSWLPGEPRSDGDPMSTKDRCAVLNATSGFWQTEDCAESHFSACNSAGEPNLWSIADGQTNYQKAGHGCDLLGTEFSLPRTSLQNTYLLHAWRSYIATHDTDDELLWLNFNDLDADTCWVIGQNSTCPYMQPKPGNATVIVPVVASVIVLVLALLTVFVKCAAYRQSSKRRRRRGDDGWDYEGVPS